MASTSNISKSDISYGKRYTWRFSSQKKTWGVKKTSKIKFWLKCCGDAVKRGHDYIRNLVSGPNKGRNCFLITLNILSSSRKQSFSIEIVWQITTMIVKSCEQLHLVDPVTYSSPAKAILLWHLCFLSTELIILCFYIQIFLIVVNLLVDWELIP